MIQIKGNFCEERRIEKSKLDPRSFRWKKNGRAWILIGCPRGSWQAKRERCAVGTKAYTILRPTKRGRCSTGKRISK